MADYIKCVLFGGGSPRNLKTFSNLFNVAVHYTYINTRYVLLLLTVPMCTNTMLSTTKYIPYILLVLLTAPM